jgi:predicted GNAT superfamily acetyltransferase
VATGQAGSTPKLTYRACESVEDFHKCVALQKTVWRFADEDLLPTRLFVVGQKIGGQIFGAFDARGKLAGFCLSIPALRNGKSYLHSHMLGVLPEYQNLHVGRRLKLMQRDDALARGIPLIEWTFDPLELKNAFFNVMRLGAIVRRYVPNQYGASSSALQHGLPTDRLVAEWWVSSERARDVIAGKPAPCSAERRIACRAEILEVKQSDSKAALAVQTRLREEFQAAFRESYAVTGFERGDKESAYLLDRSPQPSL